MLGQSYEQAGQYSKAKQIFEKLYNEQPSNYQFFQSLNDTYIQLKEYANSVKIINDRIKNGSPDINLYGMLGKTYYLQGNENKAFEVWDDATKKFPNSEVTYRVMANYALDRRAFDKAIEYLKKGEEISPNPQYFSYDLANIYSVTMQFKNATEEYCKILTQNPGQLRTIESRILSYISKPDALQKTIEVVKKYTGDGDVNFNYLLAKLYINAKDYQKAYDLYLKIDEVQKNQGAELYNFAQFLYNEKVYDVAAKVYNDLLNRYPESPFASEAKLGYAKTLESLLDNKVASAEPKWKPFYDFKISQSEDIDKVVSAYEELIKLYPHSEIANESYLRIAEIKLNKEKDLKSASEFLHKIVDDNPMSKFAAQAFMDLGKVALLENNLDQAAIEYSKVFSNGRSSEDEKANANYQLARVNFYKNDFEKSKELLSKILDNLQDNIANDALELSMLLNTSQNDSSNLVKFASAEYLAEQKNFGKAADLYKQVAGDRQKLLLENLAQYREAEMQLALSNTDTALVHLNNIAKEGNSNIYADKALYLIAQIYQFGLGNTDKAIEAYEKLLAKFPNSLYLDEARAEIIKLKKNIS